MAGAADEVHPSWFRSGPNVDATAIQKAIDSCVGSCTLMITNTYYLTKVRAWHINRLERLKRSCMHMLTQDILPHTGWRLPGRSNCKQLHLRCVGVWAAPFGLRPVWQFKAGGQDGPYPGLTPAASGHGTREHKRLNPPARPNLLQAIYLKPNVGVFSTSNAQLIGLPQGSGEGIVLRPGKYGRLLSFGNVWSFSKFAIKIQVGWVKSI